MWMEDERDRGLKEGGGVGVGVGIEEVYSIFRPHTLFLTLSKIYRSFAPQPTHPNQNRLRTTVKLLYKLSAMFSSSSLWYGNVICWVLLFTSLLPLPLVLQFCVFNFLYFSFLVIPCFMVWIDPWTEG